MSDTAKAQLFFMESADQLHTPDFSSNFCEAIREAFIQPLRRMEGRSPARRVNTRRDREHRSRIYGEPLRRIVRMRFTDARLRRQMDSMDICQSVFGDFFVRMALGRTTSQSRTTCCFSNQ